LGFGVLTVLMFAGVAALLSLQKSWKRTWPRDAALRAGLLKKTQQEDAAEVYAATA
jgi:hypothetical protein